MILQLASLLCTLLVLTAAINPRDLKDEAEEQLQQLSTLVQGEILAAHANLDDQEQQFADHITNLYDSSDLDLQQEHETIESQISTLVDLAVSSGHDVSTCTNNREEALQDLPQHYRGAIYECVFFVSLNMTQVIGDANYLVDVIMTKVHNLERQLRNCRGETSCISALVTQIELYKISLVQDIQKEVQVAESQMPLFTLSLDRCAETNIAAFVAEANSILSDIKACIDRIIG